MSQSAEGRPDESHVARHALAAIIALTYKMQPNSMLNPTVPLQMADAILAAGFARPASPPPAAADWQNDEKVNGIRNLAHERFMDEVHQYEHGSTERVRLRWSFTQDELNALCAAVAAVSRDATRNAWRLRGMGGATRGECFWSVDDNGIFHTDCGHTWEFTSAGPEENGAKWCIYCGKALRAARAKEEGRT